MIKTLSKLGLQGKFFNLTKHIYKTPTESILDEKLEAFTLISDTRQRYSLYFLPITFKHHTSSSCF